MYYLGLSNLYQGNYKSSIELLSQIKDNSPLNQKASWHKAEAYLYLGEKEEAIKILQTLPSDIDQNYSKLLESLKAN